MTTRAIPNGAVKERKRLVIIGNGPASGRLLDALATRGALERFEISVFGEEPVGCYNRVLLSKVLAGASPDEIVQKDGAWYREKRITFHAGVRAQRLDLAKHRVHGTHGVTEPFDELVLATGSRPIIPMIPGLRDDDALIEGAYVFRTLEDCESIRQSVVPGGHAVVMGGGLLGLEAAKGLVDLGMRVTVMDRAPGPMARQLDAEGQAMLARRLEQIGIGCRGGVIVDAVIGSHKVEGIRLAGGETVPCDLLVLACGIQPRIELMRSAGLPVKRALVVTPWLNVEGLPNVHGIGECVEIAGELFGTVAPIWDQIEVLADVLAKIQRTQGYRSVERYTKLKVAGVDVASFGTIEGHHDDEIVLVTQQRANICAKLRISNDRVVAAQLVGDTRAAARLLQYCDQQIPAPENPLDLLASDDIALQGAQTTQEICSCNHVSEDAIVKACREGASDLVTLGRATRAGTGCGSCQSALVQLMRVHGSQPHSVPSAA